MIESKLRQRKLVLPEAPRPIASYVPGVRHQDLIYTAGMLPLGPDGQLRHLGRVGTELSLEEGQEAARWCVLNGLAVIKEMIGSLDRIQQIIKVNGAVSSEAGFYQQSQVINGASDLLVELFGEAGRHARSVVGAVALPLNAAVMVELLVAVAPMSKVFNSESKEGI